MKRYLKKYIVRGQISASMVVRFGEAKERINFDGGSLTELGVRSAEYYTDDPLKQHIIENSDQFKKGIIELYNTVELGDDGSDEVETTIPAASVSEAEEKMVVDPNTGQQLSYPEVTNFQSAKSVLMSKFNVELKDLQDKAAVQSVASGLGISFPNWK